jgi:hypothetical protein
MCHSEIHPLHHSPSSLLPHSWDNFNTFHFSIFIHVSTVFVPYSTSHTLCLHPPHSHWYQLPRQDMFCLLFSIFVCLRSLHREFPCDISIYVCVILNSLNIYKIIQLAEWLKW